MRGEDLRLDRLFVVYPGPTRYSLADKIEVMPLKECIETLMKLK